MIWRDALALVAIWVCCGAVFTGFGALVCRVAGLQSATPRFASFWVGWAATIAILQVTSLFKPVDELDQLGIAALGLAGIIALIARGWRPQPSWRASAASVVTLIFALYVARHGLVDPRSYDTGTYHLPAVEWLNAFPVVKGLGNLHVRLAFNNSVFLYSALLNAGPLHGFAINLSLGLLFCAIVSELVFTCLVSFDRDMPRTAIALVTLPFVLAQTYTAAAEGLSPDLVLYLCGIEISLLLLGPWSPAARRPDDRAASLCAAAFVALIACTIKLSFVAFAAAVVTWIVLASGERLPRRAALSATVAGALAMGTWIVRSVLLSGYPLFPSPALPLNVPWRIPLETANENYGWIRAWARIVTSDDMTVPFQQVLANWHWLPRWLRIVPLEPWDVLIPGVLAVTAVAAVSTIGRLRRRVTISSAVRLIAPLAGIAFWFVTAPDPRFVGSLYVITAMFALAILLEAAGAGWQRPIAIAVVAVSLILVAKQIDNMRYWLGTWPDEAHFGIAKQPAVASTVTRGGVRLYVPVVAETCWAAPLPCTPYPSSDLALIDPNNPGSGFIVSPFREDALVGWWSAEHRWESMKPPTRQR